MATLMLRETFNILLGTCICSLYENVHAACGLHRTSPSIEQAKLQELLTVKRSPIRNLHPKEVMQAIAVHILVCKSSKSLCRMTERPGALQDLLTDKACNIGIYVTSVGGKGVIWYSPAEHATSST